MIVAEQLTKKFGEFTAVNALDLQVQAGEIFCFLGPNGAGKTTTIKMLCGLLHPTGGNIRIAGYSPLEHAMEIRRLTGYIPDQPYLHERLTPREYCDFVADLYQLPRAVTEPLRQRYFKELGLFECETTLIQDLSHGMRQRLIYAATFLHEPRVLFVDEPFIGLDPYSIRTIRTTLREKARAGAAIFLTTHILALAQDLADRIGIIMAGRMKACGTFAELSEGRHHDTTLEDVFMALTESQEDGSA